MLGQLAGRLRDAVRQLDAVSLQDVQERLARYLVEEEHRCPGQLEDRNPEALPHAPRERPARLLGGIGQTHVVEEGIEARPASGSGVPRRTATPGGA